VTLAFLEKRMHQSGGSAIRICEEQLASTNDGARSVDFSDFRFQGADRALVDTTYAGGSFDRQGVEIAMRKEGERWKIAAFVHFTQIDKPALAQGYREIAEAAGADRRQGRCLVSHMTRASKMQLEEEVLDGYSPTLRLKEYEGCPP
jgi:hypothetical protein